MKAALVARARAEGFDAIGVTTPDAIGHAGGDLAAFLAANFQGDMRWLGETAARRGDPSVLWPQVRSIVMLGMSYAPDADPLASLTKADKATISVYARCRDYHDVIKGKLKQVASHFASLAGATVKVFVDTAPVMEKPLAAAAGLGW